MHVQANTNIEDYYFFKKKEQSELHCARVLAMITYFIMIMVFDFTELVAKSTV